MNIGLYLWIWEERENPVGENPVWRGKTQRGKPYGGSGNPEEARKGDPGNLQDVSPAVLQAAAQDAKSDLRELHLDEDIYIQR